MKLCLTLDVFFIKHLVLTLDVSTKHAHTFLNMFVRKTSNVCVRMRWHVLPHWQGQFESIISQISGKIIEKADQRFWKNETRNGNFHRKKLQNFTKFLHLFISFVIHYFQLGIL